MKSTGPVRERCFSALMKFRHYEKPEKSVRTDRFQVELSDP